MHELSIALNLIDLACEESQRHGGRVTALHVKVGPLSGVVKGALMSAYELAREGTSLENARLEIEESPILIDCGTCAAERPARSLDDLTCADCGAAAVHIVGGRELELTALELR